MSAATSRCPASASPREANPFLGLRGLRLCLERPELFRPQVRALLRAALGRPLKVMLPMVATAGEMAEARVILDELPRRADGGGHAGARCRPLGIMVETPAAAIAIDLLPADFYSIGSNDLTQYVMAAARDAGGRVAALTDPRHPAVLRLIEQVARHGRETGLPVSLCGDMASDPALLPILLRRACGGSRWRRRRSAGSSSPSRTLRRPGRWLSRRTRPRGCDRALQDAAARRHRAPALGPARPAGPGAGQAQELRLADHQPGLRRADPGGRPADDLRDLPSLGRRARAVPGRSTARPIPSGSSACRGRADRARTPHRPAAVPTRRPRRARSRR